MINASGLVEHHQKDKADRGEARVENLNELVSAARGFEPESDLPPLQSFLSHAVLESGDRLIEVSREYMIIERGSSPGASLAHRYRFWRADA